MKKTLFLLLSVIICSRLSADISFGGQALVNTPNLAAGQLGILLVDTTGDGFSNLGSLIPGEDLFLSSTFGSSLTPIGSNLVQSAFGSVSLSGGATFDLIDGVSVGDRFGILVFESSTDFALMGDTIWFWTDDSWLIPSDGASPEFGATADFRQFTSSDSPTDRKSVV